MITLRPAQEKAVDEVREELAHVKSVLLRAPCRFGKCLGKGTPVLMADGQVKPVEEVVVGDLLMGPSGPRRVLSLARGREMMYRVTQNKGDPYVVNESHILSLKVRSDHGRGWSGHKLHNITVKDYLSGTKDFRNRSVGWKASADFIGGGELPLEPYYIGLWIGDGTCRTTEITTGDIEVKDYLHGYAHRLGLKCRVSKNSSNSEIVGISNGRTGIGGQNTILNALKVMNLVQNKHVPLVYKQATRDERLSLLAGFLDADGYCNARSGYDFTQKCERITDDIIFVARSLGFSASKRKTRKRCGNNGVWGDYFNCHISGPVHEIPVKISRKKAGVHTPKKDWLTTGIKVEAIGEDDYFGFEIDGDRLFMLGDFTVTHNTVVASYIAQRTTQNKRRVIFSCHRDAILNQVSKTFDKFGIDHGFIAGSVKPSPFLLAQVASADTLCNRLEVFDGAAGILIVDECHLWHTKTRKLIIDTAREKGWRVIGLSATPMRPDGRALSDLFDVMVYGPSEFELIMSGDLAKYRVYAPVDADLKGLKTSGGDYSREDAAERMSKPEIVGNAPQTWRTYANGLRTVVYCVNRAHGKLVAEEYERAGIPVGYIDGTMKKSAQLQVANDLADGKIMVLVSVDLLSTGFDLSSLVGRDVPIQCVQLLRPTKSLPLAIQMMMRCMTAQSGEAIILDHVNMILNKDGTTNHGFPDDDRDWNLDGKPRAKKAGETDFNVWRCDECFADVRSTKTECPYCNKEHKPKERAIVMTDGELQEIKRQEERARVDRRKEVGMSSSGEALAKIAVERGYRPGWIVQQAKLKGIPGIDWKAACVLMMTAKEELSSES